MLFLLVSVGAYVRSSYSPNNVTPYETNRVTDPSYLPTALICSFKCSNTNETVIFGIFGGLISCTCVNVVSETYSDCPVYKLNNASANSISKNSMRSY